MQKTKKEIPTVLRAASALSECLFSLTSAIVKLEEKRSTLEEKMIKKYFHEIASEVSQGSASIHEILSSGKKLPTDETLESVLTSSAVVKEKLDEFHKAIDYDWNYLEQYFEHGFYLELTESSHPLEKMRAAISKLKD